MRAGVCALLLVGLVAGLAEGHSVWRYSTAQKPQKYYDDQSFIAPEDTKEGELWSSDEDPDWEPSDIQEDQSDEYSGEDQSQDDQSYERYNQDSQSQEDQSYERYNQDSQSQEDQSYEQYNQDSQSQEDQSYEQNQDSQSQEDQSNEQYNQDSQSNELYSQEDQSQQNNGGQDFEPFPDIQFPNAEYQSQGGLQYHKLSKRGVKSHQVVQVPDDDFQDQWYRPGVSQEVDQEYTKDDEDEDEEESSGGSRIGNWFRRGWNKLSGGISHAVGYVGDKIEHVAGKIHKTYHTVEEKLKGVIVKLKSIMKKFGLLVREGIRYWIIRIQHSSDQVRESEVIEKLEQKLEQGHAETTRLFQILGEKIEKWRSEQGYVNIDTGLIEEQQGQQQGMPDFFQDRDVIIQLNKLGQEGVLTQSDIIILSEDHGDQQNQQNQQQNQNNDQQRNQNHDQQQNQNYDQQRNQNYDQQRNQNYDQQQNQNYDQQRNQNYDQQRNQNYDQQRNHQQIPEREAEEVDPNYSFPNVE